MVQLGLPKEPVAGPSASCHPHVVGGGERPGSTDSRDERPVHMVACRECGRSSGTTWRGWRAYRTDDPETNEPPALAFYCRACAEREFGAH